MRLHNFFIERFIDDKSGRGETISVSDPKRIHQWQNVFRMKPGDRLNLLDNSGLEYECEIISLSRDEATFKVIEKRQSAFVPTREVWLYQSLVKKDTFEWVAEKATELGVTHIVPVVSERSEKKELNEERLRKIVIEAAEQSLRGTLPILHPVQNLSEVFSGVLMDRNMERVALHTHGPALVHETLKTPRLSLFIGPEGGWSESEITFFKQNGVVIFCLGSQTLRSETAVAAALSIAMF